MREDFKVGFLYGLASKGVTPEELGDVLTKESHWFTDMASKGLDLTTAAAVGLPLAAGVAGGGLAYGLTRPDYNANIDQMQRQQTLNALRKYTRDAKRKSNPLPPQDLPAGN